MREGGREGGGRRGVLVPFLVSVPFCFCFSVALSLDLLRLPFPQRCSLFSSLVLSRVSFPFLFCFCSRRVVSFHSCISFLGLSLSICCYTSFLVYVLIFCSRFLLVCCRSSACSLFSLSSSHSFSLLVAFPSVVPRDSSFQLSPS